jgi:hypothetical protein
MRIEYLRGRARTQPNLPSAQGCGIHAADLTAGAIWYASWPPLPGFTRLWNVTRRVWPLMRLYRARQHPKRRGLKMGSAHRRPVIRWLCFLLAACGPQLTSLQATSAPDAARGDLCAAPDAAPDDLRAAPGDLRAAPDAAPSRRSVPPWSVRRFVPRRSVRRSARGPRAWAAGPQHLTPVGRWRALRGPTRPVPEKKVPFYARLLRMRFFHS